MKRESDWISRHIDEGEAAAAIFATGQNPDLEERVRSHIAGCEACAGRLESLRGADRDAGNLLSLLDVPAPVVSRQQILRAAKQTAGKFIGGPYRRAAAVVAFMVIATAAAAAIPNSPIRSLISRFRDSLGQQAANVVGHSTTGPAAAVSPAVLIVPESTLDVVFAHEGTAGVVHVRIVDGDQVSLSSPDSGSRYRVSSGRIDIDQSSGGSFELALPKSLQRVRILIGGKMAFERRQGAPAGPDDFTIELAHPNRVTRSHPNQLTPSQ